MTRIEHLLWILAEECAEVAQRASKAARFGLQEVQPGQHATNEDRLRYELNDLNAVAGMLLKEGIDVMPNALMMEQKQQKVESFLEYSRNLGKLTD